MYSASGLIGSHNQYVPTIVNSTDGKQWSIISWESVKIAEKMSYTDIKLNQIKDTNIVMSHCHWTSGVYIIVGLKFLIADILKPKISTKLKNIYL